MITQMGAASTPGIRITVTLVPVRCSTNGKLESSTRRCAPRPSVQPRRPATGAGARSPDDAQPAMPLHPAGERPSANVGSHLPVPARCCNAVVVSSVGPRGGATAVMTAPSCSTSRCWRPTSAFVVSLLVAALANILLSTSSSASPPMTVSKLDTAGHAYHPKQRTQHRQCMSLSAPATRRHVSPGPDHHAKLVHASGRRSCSLLD